MCRRRRKCLAQLREAFGEDWHVFVLSNARVLQHPAFPDPLQQTQQIDWAVLFPIGREHVILVHPGPSQSVAVEIRLDFRATSGIMPMHLPMPHLSPPTLTHSEQEAILRTTATSLVTCLNENASSQGWDICDDP